MEIFEYKLDQRAWKEKSGELEKFLGRSDINIEGDYRRIVNEEKEIEASLHGSLDKKEVSEYYRKTPRYLYELLRWEASFDKQNNFKLIYSFLSKNRVRKTLDFGAGIGGMVIFLNKRKIACDYLDIPGKTWDFAKWRFGQTGMNVNMYDPLKDYPAKKYRAIIAYDVLEHLPDMKEQISRICDILETKGYFLAKSTFSGGGLHLKANEEYVDIKRFNALLAGCGLRYLGRLKKFMFSFRLSRKEKYGGNFLLYQKK